MIQGESPKSQPHFLSQGLMIQLVTIILLPLTVILLVITIGSITIHQRAMRSMVGEWDSRLVRTAAKALSAQIDLRAKELAGYTQMLSVNETQSNNPSFARAALLFPDFDKGLAILDGHGNVITASGNLTLWDRLLDNPGRWTRVYSGLVAQPGKLMQMNSPLDDTPLGLIAYPIDSEKTLVGGFSIPSMVENTLVDILPAESQLSTLLLDADRKILYKSGVAEDYSSEHPGIAEALQGKSGTAYVKSRGDEHVTAFSPVPSIGWALITEESWEAVSTPTLRMTQIAPLVLVPAVLIMLLALWLGTRQVVHPLRKLEGRAATLATGDFTSIQEPVGGIAEIQHLQRTLVEMAHKVQDAQRSLHGYIGAITTAQEEERLRLARELHDDTLQSLIALKQRVQLTQLELQSSVERESPEIEKLNEVAIFTEHTIDNLRRLTSDLRPMYLEDLGLVPALEMLAQEAGQGMGIKVEFHRQGVEKRLLPAVELALFRMAQEALSNVARHAQAKQASLKISFSPTSTTMEVIDDGVGFNVPESPSEFAPKGHYGLLGLHERAALMGARLFIQSSPGEGTYLMVTITE